MRTLFDLPTLGPGGSVNVVVEASKDTSAKCKFDRTLGAFLYSRPLPRGLVYPFDWGFIPSTCAEDGDPLDAMVIHSEACPVGAVIRCRPAAILQVQQRQDGEALRNDRLLLTPIETRTGEEALITRGLKKELEQFFRAVVLGRGKELRTKGWAGERTALATIRKASSLYAQKFSRDSAHKNAE